MERLERLERAEQEKLITKRLLDGDLEFFRYANISKEQSTDLLKKVNIMCEDLEHFASDTISEKDLVALMRYNFQNVSYKNVSELDLYTKLKLANLKFRVDNFSRSVKEYCYDAEKVLLVDDSHIYLCLANDTNNNYKVSVVSKIFKNYLIQLQLHLLSENYKPNTSMAELKLLAESLGIPSNISKGISIGYSRKTEFNELGVKYIIELTQKWDSYNVNISSFNNEFKSYDVTTDINEFKRSIETMKKLNPIIL